MADSYDHLFKVLRALSREFALPGPGSEEVLKILRRFC